MQGRTCVITGGSDGIGLETALGLARLGATIVLTGRTPAKVAAAVERVRQESGRDDATGLIADFARLDDVRKLAAQIGEVDVLVNNAGVMLTRRAVTDDGNEMTFQVNHLAPYLLTRLLLDRLRPPARIVTVSSVAHVGGRIRAGGQPQRLRGFYIGWRAYCDSKLANILFTRELRRRLAGSGVTATCLHPGSVRTHLGRGNLLGLGLRLLPWDVTPEQGALTSIWLASAPEVAGQSGGYYAKCRPATTAPQARDDDTAAWLWKHSADLVGLRGSEPPPVIAA